MPVHLTPMPTERVPPGAEVFPARRRRASFHILLSVIGVVLTLQNCDKGSRPPHPDPDRLLAELPDIEIPSEPGSLGSLVGWALKQAPPALRYWELVNVEAALDFTGAGSSRATVFAGLPLGTNPIQSPARIPRRLEENPCPARVDRSDASTGKINLELRGGCEALVSGIPIRYEGRLLLSGEFLLGNLRLDHQWEDWGEESPLSRKIINGEQTLSSQYLEDGSFSAMVERRIQGAAGSEALSENFQWAVSGWDGEEVMTKGSWVSLSGSSMLVQRVEIGAARAPAEPGSRPDGATVDGTAELGLAANDSLLLFSGGRRGRITARLEGLAIGACPSDRSEPTAGRIILESVNTFEIVFSEECDGCGILSNDGRKVCWTTPPETPEEPQETTSTEAGEGRTTEPPTVVQPPVSIPVVEPVFTLEIRIASNQVTLSSQDLSLALPEGYRSVSVEGDVAGIFFDRSDGVRGFAVTGPSEGAAATKLSEMFKGGTRINGTDLPAESAVVVSTVNSLRLTSVEGKPMTLQTFAVGFLSPRSWESVTAQAAAAVGLPASKADISMPGVEVGDASGLTSKDFIVALGSVAREDGKSLLAASVAPLDRFDELSAEMFQTVGAATQAGVDLVKKEETFTAKSEGPEIAVSSSVVDVLWVIDDSGSMSEEQANLAANFDAFFRQFVALNLDYHLGVVTTDCDIKAECGRLRKLSTGALFIQPQTPGAEAEWKTISRPGTYGSASERPLLAAREALTSRETDTVNAGFRRAGASLVAILVTDEVDQSYEGAYTNSRPGLSYTPPTPFMEFIQTQGAAVFAITGDPAAESEYGGCTSLNGNADAGNAVIEVAESTGGSWASICSSTFAPTLSLISQAIGTKSSRFRLSQPAIPSRIRVFVDGIEVRRSITSKEAGIITQRDGFIYDVASRTVSFVGTRFRPQTGQIVRVVYLAVEKST